MKPRFWISIALMTGSTLFGWDDTDQVITSTVVQSVGGSTAGMLQLESEVKLRAAHDLLLGHLQAGDASPEDEQDLEHLARTAEWLTPDDVTDAWDHVFECEVEHQSSFFFGDDYMLTLSSAGADGSWNTEDDLSSG